VHLGDRTGVRDALLARRHLVELMLAAALGYALFRALDSFSHLWIDLLVQHVGPQADFLGEGGSTVLGLLRLFASNQAPGLLYFEVGGTYVPYGAVLAPLSTLLLVAAAARLLPRLQRRCPYCRSVVAREASVCSACSLSIEPDATS
jgi:hypothetical protein